MEDFTGIAKIVKKLRDFYQCYLDNSTQTTNNNEVLYKFNYKDCCTINVTKFDIWQEGQSIYIPKEVYRLLVELSDILETL